MSDRTPLAERRWLTVSDLVDYLGFPTTNAAHKWLRPLVAQGYLRPGRRGRALLLLRVEVDRVVESRRTQAARAALKAVG